MKNEIYQRYRETRTIKTKANKTLTVKVPCGVFVALKTNKGGIRAGQSVLHKKDRFDMKTGLNQARKHASSPTSIAVNVSKEREEAFNKFILRAQRYFGLLPKNQNDWTGQDVILTGYANLDKATYYHVVLDHGSTVDVYYGKRIVGDTGMLRLYYNQPKSFFELPKKNANV